MADHGRAAHGHHGAAQQHGRQWREEERDDERRFEANPTRDRDDHGGHSMDVPRGMVGARPGDAGRRPARAGESDGRSSPSRGSSDGMRGSQDQDRDRSDGYGSRVDRDRSIESAGRR